MALRINLRQLAFICDLEQYILLWGLHACRPDSPQVWGPLAIRHPGRLSGRCCRAVQANMASTGGRGGRAVPAKRQMSAAQLSVS